MRLRGWHVEGFGVLHDFRVEDLTDGLTIVYGPNESGKTSLLAFIRGVFFGYPDRRQKERQYPPLRGGRHGGRVFVESDQSTWTVERFASPAYLSNHAAQWIDRERRGPPSPAGRCGCGSLPKRVRVQPRRTAGVEVA